MAASINSGIDLSGARLEDAVILLVEDRGDDILIVLRAFEQAGLKNRVVVCRDGEEAIQYLNGEGLYTNRHEYPLPRTHLPAPKLHTRAREGAGLTYTTQRKPMWLVDVSIASGCRAAGRYRRQ